MQDPLPHAYDISACQRGGGGCLNGTVGQRALWEQSAGSQLLGLGDDRERKQGNWDRRPQSDSEGA
jgi:hypothetical protein